jgi:YegS/Rv2252/BmrU family lipid kinase
MAREEVLVVLNPTAGRGKAGRSEAQLRSDLTEIFRDKSVRFAITQRGGHAGELAAAVDSNTSLVIAVGGDGTISQVANGLAGKELPMGIVPGGTGNDLARGLGIANYAAALSALRAGNVRRIDALRASINGADVLSLNAGGSGFDGVVAEWVNTHCRQIGGTLAYVLGMLNCLPQLRANHTTLTVDGERMEMETYLCAVCNSSSFGGGLNIAPMADLTDGLADVIVIGDVGKIGFLREFPKVFSGRHIEHPKVHHFRAKEVELKTEPALPTFVDGEMMGPNPIRFQVLPQAVPMIVPVAA